MRHDRKKEALQRLRGHGQMMKETSLKMTDSDGSDKTSFNREDDAEYDNQDLVLVRLKDFPEWPARVQKAEDFGLFTIPEMIFVTCFGTNEVRFCWDYEVSPFTPNKRRALQYKLNQQSTERSFKLAIKEIMKLDKQTRAADFCGRTVKVEKQCGVSYPTKKVRRMKISLQGGDIEAAQKYDHDKGVEEILNQESEICEEVEGSLFRGRKMKTFGGVIISARHRSSEREFEAETDHTHTGRMERDLS